MAGRPGRKPKMTLEEQIEQVSNDIEAYKESVKTLEDKKKELLKQKREEDLSALYELMQDMNLSVDNVKGILNDIKNQQGKEESDSLEALRVVWFEMTSILPLFGHIGVFVSFIDIHRFYGIVIKMFFKPKEHEPSHLHALYGEHIGIFDLRTMEMTEGDLPKKRKSL